MSTKSEQNRLGVVFPPGLDADGWATGFKENRVPDRWPYGLHRLKDSLAEPIALQTRPLAVGDKAALVAHLLRSPRSSALSSGLDVGVAWDEYTAAKMVAQYPARAMFSGVIWATDVWRSGNHSLRGEVTKRLLQSLTGLWCLSRPQSEIIRRVTRGRIPVDYLPFGIDQDFFEYAEQPAGMRILSLGIDRDRDPETLFAALEIVRRAVPQAEILVQTNSVQALPVGVTKFERVPHSVLRDFYRTANVVLVSTKHNLHASGMTVALEAGATGRPVVACDTPGMDDYVIHGRTGLLVRPGDAVGMAAATLEVLHDREFASRLGIGARRHVERGHTSDLMVRKLGEIIAKGI